MADPERACFPHQPDDRTAADCQRLYGGAEFCFWRFPDLPELDLLLDESRRRDIGFTLVTPLVHESERALLGRRLAGFLPRLGSDDEVVISDWGVLELVRSIRSDLTIVLGRVLSGQKRGPRITRMELKAEELDYFRQGSWYSRSAAALLAEHGIRRVELDNLLQGLAPLPDGLAGSLHLPYAMVTSSRNCPYRSQPTGTSCPAPCGEVFVLETEETDHRLLQAGNTQFIEVPRPPDELVALGIDRLVIHPSLPL